jgi:hypothetical protein
MAEKFQTLMWFSGRWQVAELERLRGASLGSIAAPLRVPAGSSHTVVGALRKL